MNRTLFLRPIAIIALALTGCAGDKAAPQLSSPDRSDRIEAVKTPPNTYAVPAPAAPTANKPAESPSRRFTPAPLMLGDQPARDDRAIEGCWTMQAEDQVYFWIFDADGSCKEAAGIAGPLGKLFFVYHAEGAYRLLPGKAIEVTYHTGPKDRKVRKLKYRLSKDTLELNMGDHWREFNRITQEPHHLSTITHKEHKK